MRVGEVAERAGVNVETLRYYERRGLLPEPARTPNGHRRYDDETVRFVRAVKEAQALGFTLAEIEDYLRVSRRGAAHASEELRIRMAAKIDEVDARIAGLRRVRADLARVVGCACDSLDHCTCGAAHLARSGRAVGAPAGTLHVTNGDSAAGTLARTTLGGSVLAWRDALHEGPVPAVARQRLRTIRAEFLSACGWGSVARLRRSFAGRDEQLGAAIRERRHVVLWFEHDLYDQLQLLDALALAHESGLDDARVELIVIGSFPGKPAFRGLGELTADELETLWPARVPVTAALGATARDVWAAIRASDPLALAAAAATGVDGLPYLGAALRRLLEELPQTGDGLSRTERHVLHALEGGPLTAGALFLATQASDEAPYLGDTWFFRTVAALGTGEQRLVETTAGAPVPAPPPLGDARGFAQLELRVTDTGRAVLRGDADRVSLVELDRWVLGTHVTSAFTWRWDPAEGLPVLV